MIIIISYLIYELKLVIVLTVLIIFISKKIINDFEQKLHALEIFFLEIKQIEKKTAETTRKLTNNASNEFVKTLINKIKNIKRLQNAGNRDLKKNDKLDIEQEIAQKKPFQENIIPNQISQYISNSYQNPKILKAMNAKLSYNDKKTE